jgi:hypothetical protein
MCTFPHRRRSFHVQRLVEGAAIRKAGQRIQYRQMLELILQRLLRCDVAHDEHKNSPSMDLRVGATVAALDPGCAAVLADHSMDDGIGREADCHDDGGRILELNEITGPTFNNFIWTPAGLSHGSAGDAKGRSERQRNGGDRQSRATGLTRFTSTP